MNTYVVALVSFNNEMRMEEVQSLSEFDAACQVLKKFSAYVDPNLKTLEDVKTAAVYQDVVIGVYQIEQSSPIS